jgi:hypothetical protein
MNYGRVFMPNIMPFRGPMINMAPYKTSFLERTINGIKSFDWKGLLNGANKTLNVMNQTLPLIREARPMFQNMKSMVNLIKAFGKETENTKPNKEKIHTEKKEVSNNNYPNFFL